MYVHICMYVYGCICVKVIFPPTRWSPLSNFLPTHEISVRPRAAPSLDTAILKHLRSICEVYGADSAADEQFAGQLLRPNSGRTVGKGQLPNLRVVIRDPAHASRRLFV